MIMGAAVSTVYYNLKQRHMDMSVIDYDLALLFQPVLVLGISIGVAFNVIFADWMITVLLIILFLYKREFSRSSFYLSEHLLTKIILNWIFFILLLRNGSSFSAPDVEGDALFGVLAVLKDSNHKIDWSHSFVSPCSGWSHVTCLSGHVTYLSLGSIGFSGTLSPAICKLKFLNSLELKDNNLSGELPKCLRCLVSLKTLDLSHNRFTGSIPSSWAHLPSLKHL